MHETSTPAAEATDNHVAGVCDAQASIAITDGRKLRAFGCFELAGTNDCRTFIIASGSIYQFEWVRWHLSFYNVFVKNF